ncbi:DUF3885 domain-containing protein [Streptomyces flaveolus]|uniref:DUF3885 domain-containing protein n=1 Tax=Streptomyces flaveolus TaxID=67297 RepID=UPI003F4DB905
MADPARGGRSRAAEFRTHCHLFAARRPWRCGCIDEVLRDIADDKVAGVLITDTQMRRIHHPYDGGADVFLTTPHERDRTRDRHTDWLSSHPSGLRQSRTATSALTPCPGHGSKPIIGPCPVPGRHVPGRGRQPRPGRPSCPPGPYRPDWLLPTPASRLG